MKWMVTGGAGFIGSNLVDRLLAAGHEVVVYDNFSTGHREFLEGASKSDRFTLVEGDTRDEQRLPEAMAGCDIVFHFAANADVRFGTSHPERDLEQNTIATFMVLEAMRKANVKRICFSSTGAIYGEATQFPTPENAEFPVQTSLYGASKLAGEGMINAYCHGFDFQSYIFRFVSITGERYNHGHVFDFYKKLQADPTRMEVLGDGSAAKSYLYIQDCIDAILLAADKATDRVNIFNLGTETHCTVNDSISWICERLGLNPRLEYTGGKQGWVGDNSLIYLDTRRIRSLGWEPKVAINDGIVKTLDYLVDNPWLFEPGR
mgnify:CR=1 FL=1